ncbi:CPSF A subunit region-domain-containing protein [Roridomyces roridus]|uniref:CPSF A subunit region-domain-containing protein n=1 Tax=Roridomyces roridus TaxID=1738132 RepID=A0AAD7CBB8_9AGAR|nr:CPSF A subunit region-domain-containing protein [Roridomyces roridus]
MHLYHLTLQRPTAAIQAIVGNFSGLRQQEIIVAHNASLELFRVDAQSGKLSSVVTADVFGSIRCLEPFKLVGSNKDYIIVGSDSGRIVILEFSESSNKFTKVHQETYGKTGVRRTVPGAFLATDPRGRSVMIAAQEKSKLVYILNRDAASNLTISSPLEAHRTACIIHHIVGVDVGFENPMFAALEVDYAESDQDPTAEAAQKMLTYYELDLGLNHVVRKWSEPTDSRANLLVQVPGGHTSAGVVEGPSSVLVCCENHVIYHKIGAIPHRVPIPRRHGVSERQGLLIVTAVMHKMKGAFFFLLQSEVGDLYKVTLDLFDEQVHSMSIKYFDTVPVARSLCILKSGFLFVASEFGNQCLYQFQTLGDDDNEIQYSSSSYPEFGMSPLPHVYFHPRPLQNLVLADEIISFNPIIDAQVSGTESPQIFAACGRGSRSSFRTLRHGVRVEEVVSCDVQSTPNGVWAIKRAENDPKDVYIVLSFGNGTLVFSIGEALVEVQDAGFLLSAPSLAIQQLGSDSLVQVHPSGVRHILFGGKVQEWTPPSGLTITSAVANQRQIVVALSSAEIVYFELDLDGQLNEYQERKAMGSAVLALGLGAVEDGRQRYSYLSVGCQDQTVRIFSLDPENTLESLSLQALASPPASICMINHLVYIGLQNGVLLQTVLDTSTGQFVDTSSRFLGTRPVRLSRIRIQGMSGIIALSSRSWIAHIGNSRMTPLLHENIDHGCSFTHDLCPDGFIGTTGSILRIFRTPKLDDKLDQTSTSLCHTPRQMVRHPNNGYFYIVEGDTNRAATDSFPGSWVSSVHILDPIKRETVACVPLDSNEAAFSIAIVPFSAREGQLILVVGTATDVILNPRSYTSGFLRTYLFKENGEIELHHKTAVDDIPLALGAFQGRLVAGVGRALRLYDIGKQKLLLKAENKSFASTIMTLHTQGSRIVVGDMQHSLNFIAFKEHENRLLLVADDTQSRWTTCSTMLDYNTAIAGDRFGNVFVNRLSPDVSAAVDSDPTGDGILREKPLLNGAPHKTSTLAHFYLGDLPTSIQKASLVTGAREVIIYTGLHGTIGMFVPLVSTDDIDFLVALEQRICSEQGSLVGRNHLSWRGYYVPVKGVVDGDLCESFQQLSNDWQRVVAAELDRSVGEVAKKLEQIRVMASGF